MKGIFDWFRRHPWLIGLAVGVWIVIKAGKWALIGVWEARDLIPLGDSSGFVRDHWPLILAGAAALIIVAMLVSRAVAYLLARRPVPEPRLPPPPTDGQARLVTLAEPPTPEDLPPHLAPGEPLASDPPIIDRR